MLRQSLSTVGFGTVFSLCVALSSCQPIERTNCCDADNENNDDFWCYATPPSCPPCEDPFYCSLPAECWTSPPNCEVCPDPRICPKPDGGVDGDVDDFDIVADVVQPDIPETEPDPHLYMVECAAMTGGGLPGYLSLYGTWDHYVLMGQQNYPSATERYTQLYIADLDDYTIRVIGQVPEIRMGNSAQAIVIDDASRMAYFINQKWVVPLGCTEASCRYYLASLWGIGLDTWEVARITDDAEFPLETEHCASHHGFVSISAIDTVNNWLTVDCEYYNERGEGLSPMVAFETYRIHLVTGEIQPISDSEKLYSPSTVYLDSGHGAYRFAWSNEWNADRTGWLTDSFGFHVWDLHGAVPIKVYERYYGRDEIASGTGVAIDGWYYWNELVDGHLQIRGVDVVTGEIRTTDDPTFEKAGAHPAGRAVPHLVSFFGGTGFLDYMGMIATTQEGIHLWDKELNLIRRATPNLPFRFGVFFNGTESTRWMLLTADVGSETCLFVRDLHAAGVIDPLTNRLLPEE